MKSQKLAPFLLSLLVTLIITWSIGFIVVSFKHFLLQPWTIYFIGVLNNLLIVSIVGVVLLPFYFFFPFKRILHLISHLVFSFIVLMEIISSFFFEITLKPLNHAIFQFDQQQASIILDNYFVFRWYYLLLILPPIIYFFGTHLFQKKHHKRWIIFIFLPVLLIPFVGLQWKPQLGSFSEFPINKSYFFVHSFFLKNKENSQSFQEDIEFYQKHIEKSFPSTKYPLFHPTSVKNSLGPFFKLKEKPPNIVFLVVESLSSSYCGPDADEISYTPFLDSLAPHSLYFENSLATAERSFAVLPSLLGSLPHGSKGFTNNPSGYPTNQTLPKWLFKNGYTGSFHFGGYAHFDYMDLFMKNQGFQNIYDRSEYNYEGTGLKTSIDSIPFGIPDKKLMKSIIHKHTNGDLEEPFIDVYVTLSMHYPYMIEDHEAYYKKVKKVIQQAKAPEETKEKHRKYIAEFATFLYTDDALQWYFKEEQKSSHFKNTIYVILGDHMMGEIPHTSPIERYRSVLMIYSPLLNRSKSIKATNTQLDIAPSFYNLLQQRYDYNPINAVSWLGEPMDTSATFKCDRDVLFMLNDRRTEDILYKDWYLFKDHLYKVHERLRLKHVENIEQLNLMKKLLVSSAGVHREVVQQNRLIPSHEDLQKIAHISKKITFDENVEYGSIYNTRLKKNYKEIIVDIQFQLINGWKQNNEKNPLLICSIKRDGENMIWYHFELENIINNTNEIYHFNKIFKNNLDFQFQKGDKLTVCFWNKDLPKINFKANIKSLSIEGK